MSRRREAGRPLVQRCTMVATDAQQQKPDADITVVCWLDGGDWQAGWWDDEEGVWFDAATGGQLQGVTHWGCPPSLPAQRQDSRLFQRDRWLKARELKRQGLSNLQIGLELDPPCAASVVHKGLQRLARRENVRAKRLDTAQETGEGP